MNTPQPSERMTAFVLSLLAPFLAAAGITDPDLARQAAAETVAAYNVAAANQLVTVAQIVAFALAALDNLKLSLPENLSLSMKLRLRGNAATLTRISQQAAAGLDTASPAPEPDPAEILASLAKTPPSQPDAPQSGPAGPQRQTDLAWAGAMTDIAAEFAAELPGLPPPQRRDQLARISVLSAVSATLRQGKAPPLKARLLGSTAIRT